jgi:hypothetical protein
VENPVTQKLPPKLNAATHWMTSRQPLIPSESRAALQAHLEHWNRLYPDVETDELLSDLVREAAFDQWLLFRSQRQYDSSVAKLYETEIDDWTPEHHKTFQLRERYLNAAQRRFNRHRSDILQYQGNLRSQARENRAANDYAQAQKAEKEAQTPPAQETPPPRPEKTSQPYVQAAIVRQKNGKTETYLNPDNQFILDYKVKSHYETALVIRAIRFEDHFVPPEYEAFTARVARRKELGQLGEVDVPITFRNWRIAIEREKEFGGHIREWPDLRAEDESIIQIALAEDRKAYAEFMEEERKRKNKT